VLVLAPTRELAAQIEKNYVELNSAKANRSVTVIGGASMVRQMDAEGFGNCTNTYECEAVCPAEISASFIAKLNREYALASLRERVGE